MAGWNTTNDWNWQMRHKDGCDLAPQGRRWTAPDIGITIVAFLIHWELGLAFLALKLWHQASGHDGNVFTFAREKWDGLVLATRQLLAGDVLSAFSFGPRSSGNLAFDAWRQQELTRIEAERRKLRAAEREFAAYRDELLQARDKETFDRFMQSRGSTAPNA